MKDKLANAEEVDEDDMYEQEGRVFSAVEPEQDDFVVNNSRYEPKETLVVFEDNQFLLYDFKNGTSWQVGDVEGGSGYNPIAQDAAIVPVDQLTHRTEAMQAIVVGGTKGGAACKQVLALTFDKIQ